MVQKLGSGPPSLKNPVSSLKTNLKILVAILNGLKKSRMANGLGSAPPKKPSSMKSARYNRGGRPLILEKLGGHFYELPGALIDLLNQNRKFFVATI